MRTFESMGGRAAVTAAQAARDATILVSVVVNAAQTEACSSAPTARPLPWQRAASSSRRQPCRPTMRGGWRGAPQRSGLHYLDAPISGGAAKAAAGALTIMASGTAPAFAVRKAGPRCDGRTVYELGDDARHGRCLQDGEPAAGRRSHRRRLRSDDLRCKARLDLATVYKVITASAGSSWMFENRVPHILDGDYSPRSAVEIFTKDLGIVSDMGRKEKFPLSIAATALQMFLMTAASGMAKDDDASVARMIAKVTGIDLPPAK